MLNLLRKYVRSQKYLVRLLKTSISNQIIMKLQPALKSWGSIFPLAVFYKNLQAFWGFKTSRFRLFKYSGKEESLFLVILEQAEFVFVYITGRAF